MIKTFEELYKELEKICSEIEIELDKDDGSYSDNGYVGNISLGVYDIYKKKDTEEVVILYGCEHFITSKPIKDLDKVYNFIKAYIELEND
ncbi:MAG: hypothetical protein BV456_00900 [Thermoplasmata archaeon M8B2D]|nr:MAG: hypothetical protein BV456_00900 [Thermoplasmata archaeon M8B2D]